MDACYRVGMTRLKINLILIALTVLTGCTAGGTSRSSSGATTPGNDPQTPAFERDRQAILGMAGTFKVEFFFEETLALRDGYELHDPYRTDAEELVVVAQDTGDTAAPPPQP